MNAASEEIHPNVNPFITNAAGYYGWDVAEGCWYVTVTADGYHQLVSPVVGVPTAVTDLNLKLTPTKLPAITGATPTIDGKAKVGSKLTAKPGKWDPAGVKLAYQWKRNGVAIKKATSSTYKLVTADVGKKVSVTVTGSKTGLTTVAKTSAGVSVFRAMTAKTPKISGKAKVGSKLKAKPGKWKPAGVKFTYQWKRNGVAIKKATKSTYKLVAVDKGKKTTVTVTGSKAGYAQESRTSKQVKAK